MVILAFDLGRSVGIAYGDVGGRVTLDQADLSESIGPMMSAFEGVVRGHIRRIKPDLVFWERPFIAIRPGRMDAQGEIRTQRLYGQAAALAKLAHEHEISSASERPMTIRKAIVGRGNATEEDIAAFCRKRDIEAPTPHQADAFVAWLYASRKK